MPRTHIVEPLPDCPCRRIILLSRSIFGERDIDERNLFAWDCPTHNPIAARERERFEAGSIGVGSNQ